MALAIARGERGNRRKRGRMRDDAGTGMDCAQPTQDAQAGGDVVVEWFRLHIVITVHAAS